MDTKKTIVVVGSTGAQGGGLVRAILNDPDHEFNVRAITRDVNSDKAKALESSALKWLPAMWMMLKVLKKLLKGLMEPIVLLSSGTISLLKRNKENAKAMAEAAKHAGVKHVIWSTLDDTRKWIPLSDDRMPTLMGKYKVPHFDAKGEANHFFTDLGFPVTLLNTSFYWDNFIYFGLGPKKGADGKLAITFPMGDKKLPGIAAADIGKCALGIFKSGQKYIGKLVGIAGEHLTGKQMAQGFTKHWEKK